MNARILPYLLIAPVTLFLCLFFLYPFFLVAHQAFTEGMGFTRSGQLLEVQRDPYQYAAIGCGGCAYSTCHGAAYGYNDYPHGQGSGSGLIYLDYTSRDI